MLRPFNNLLRAPEGDTSGGGGVPEGQATTVAADPPVAVPPAAPVNGGKIVQMSSQAIGRIKAEERRRGHKTAMSELDAEARKDGFKSFDDMKASALRSKQRAAAPAASPVPKAGQPTVAAAPAAQTRDARLARRVAEETKQRKRLQRELDAREAEMELRVSAARHGCRDVDYALALLKRQLGGSSEAELASFDEEQFFGKDLQKSHPYLFGVQSEPAQTAPTVGAPAPAPKADVAGTADADSKQVDARKMSREEYLAHLRSKGLAAPDAGLSF